MTEPASHKLTVHVTVDPGADTTVSVAIPTWTPGYYQILNFQQDILGVSAHDSRGKDVAVRHPDELTWEAPGRNGPITFAYSVRAQDAGFGFFRSHLDDKTGYVNGASALMYAVGGKNRHCRLQLTLPEGWKQACSLDPDAESSYKAADYDELIDCPIQAGAFERLDFTVRDVPFSAILVGSSEVDRKALVDTLTSISAAGIELFRGAPFKRYYYLFHFSQGNFGGGLEHRSSTVLNISGGSAGERHPWASLISHEYFHAWNVKYIHPAALGPFDYTQKVRTGALWFAEGVTDYYAHVLLRMAGITAPREFLATMSGQIAGLQSNDARIRVTAEEASQKAWEGGSFGFGGLSYYEKGLLLGFMFDTEIRAATHGARSLDDVMRLLDQQYARKGRGYPENGILLAINAVSGRDMTEDYDRYVRWTAEIPWKEVLARAGLDYQDQAKKSTLLGVSTHAGSGGEPVVELVLQGSAAEKAGIKNGDVIMTLNGSTVTDDSLKPTVSDLRAGDKVTLTVRRGGQPTKIEAVLGEAQGPRYRIDLKSNIDSATRAVQQGLLRAAPTVAQKPASAAAGHGPGR